MTRHAHAHAAPHLASDDALARTHTTEQAAGVDAAAEAAATGGLIIPCPGGAGAAPGQVLPPSPLPGDGDSNESFERTAADRGEGAVWDGAGPASLPLGAGGGLACSVGLSLPCSVGLDSLLETTNNYYYFYEMMMMTTTTTTTTMKEVELRLARLFRGLLDSFAPALAQPRRLVRPWSSGRGPPLRDFICIS